MRPIKFFFTGMRRFCSSKSDKLKLLRDITGAPLMKCKEALDKFATIEEAKAFLREKNLVMADKKAGNAATEGVLGLSVQPGKIIVSKVNSETDFVAKNEEFLNFVQETVKTIDQHSGHLKTGQNELTPEILSNFKTSQDDLLERQKMITAKIQENIKISESFLDTFDPSHIAGTYIHRALRPNVGTSLGYVIVEQNGPAPRVAVEEVANDLAVHIFCKSPTYVSFDTIPKDIIEQTTNQIKASLKEDKTFDKKPKDIQEKIFDGKIKKAFDDEILTEQIADFWDSEKTVGDYLKDFERRHSTKVKVIRFNSLKIK